MNPGFLQILNEAYERVRHKHGSMFKNFEFIDTSVSTKSTQNLLPLMLQIKFSPFLNGHKSEL
jgi:hypothetical protein